MRIITEISEQELRRELPLLDITSLKTSPNAIVLLFENDPTYVVLPEPRPRKKLSFSELKQLASTLHPDMKTLFLSMEDEYDFVTFTIGYCYGMLRMQYGKIQSAMRAQNLLAAENELYTLRKITPLLFNLLYHLIERDTGHGTSYDGGLIALPFNHAAPMLDGFLMEATWYQSILFV